MALLAPLYMLLTEKRLLCHGQRIVYPSVLTGGEVFRQSILKIQVHLINKLTHKTMSTTNKVIFIYINMCSYSVDL